MYIGLLVFSRNVEEADEEQLSLEDTAIYASLSTE